MWGDKLNSNNWGTALVMEKLEWTSVIPKNLAPGSYLIRHELLSLHQKKISQFYAQCAQVVVSGEGTATPPDDYLYTIPSYAAQDDPGVLVSLSSVSRRLNVAEICQVDIFTDKSTTYTCPGGAVWDQFTA